ncbi:MAG TPA: flagellar basal body P-ring protein FlgI [Pirellulales bacterium]|jgi:flagellar basal body P-ring protein FlgI|nr:flagellar basal body P-ring protein FlgI [Pirellulales bacterium]
MKPCRAWFVCWLLSACGCATPALRTQSPEDFSDALKSTTRLIGDAARPFGHTFVKVESVALVTGLDNTGGDPAPSPQRAALLHELQTIGVQNPNQLLASPSTAMVLVRGFLPPGVKKGDKIDLEVQVPARSETTSLRGGWLMETRMTELAVLGGQIHEGHPWAIGEGAVLVDPSANSEKDKTLLVRGRVLGGGTALKSRDLGLFIGPEDKSIRLSYQIGEAINRRFHTFSKGIKQGVANPRSDERIDLKIHPRYKDNIARYLRVVRAIPIKESPSDEALRITLLERQLLDPITASAAAIRLEAIGKGGVEPLAKGISASDPEVCFYSAEALAYLDESQAAVPLARAAREEPAFRAYALAALSTIDDMGAHDELVGLLDLASSETRYGAFRALWAMNSNDPLIRGENLGGQFSYHLLNSTGPPMIHVTRSYRPEVVIFGHEQCLETPFVLEAGKSILVKGVAADKVIVSKFAVGQPDQKRQVTNKVDDVIRAIVELGGMYPDVVQALQQAKSSHALVGRFEVDALPDGGRAYRAREQASAEGDSADSASPIEVASPMPDLFSSKKRKSLR